MYEIMSVYKDKTGHYQYAFMYNGVRYHRRFKDATYEEVVAFETVAKSELIKSGYDITKDRHNIMLSEIINDYKIYANNNYSRPDEAIGIVENFYRLIGNKPVEKLNISDMENYRSMRKAKVKNATVNREVGNIRRVFSLAKQNQKIRYNPFEDLKPLKQKNPTKRFLQKDEEEKLLSVCNPTLKAIIIFAIHTGMREGEIKNLKWSDVFLKDKYLIALNTKNGKPRKLLITKQMEEEFKNIPKIGDYVFTNPATKTRYKDFISTFKRAVIKSGIPHISFHELRHTTASRLNEIGVDLSTIQEYLDHADARTTQKYIHKPKKNILDAVNRLSDY